MNDKHAKSEAEDLMSEFWERFDAALTPKKASKQAYQEMLELLADEAESRIACIKDEIAAENGES